MTRYGNRNKLGFIAYVGVLGYVALLGNNDPANYGIYLNIILVMLLPLLAVFMIGTIEILERATWLVLKAGAYLKRACGL